MWIVLVSKPFVPSSSRTALRRDGPQKPLVASSIGRGVATSSLMWMPPGRPHDSEPCPATLPSPQQNGGSTRSVRLATPDASQGRGAAHPPQGRKLERAHGAATMHV